MTLHFTNNEKTLLVDALNKKENILCSRVLGGITISIGDKNYNNDDTVDWEEVVYGLSNYGFIREVGVGNYKLTNKGREKAKQ